MFKINLSAKETKSECDTVTSPKLDNAVKKRVEVE